MEVQNQFAIAAAGDVSHAALLAISNDLQKIDESNFTQGARVPRRTAFFDVSKFTLHSLGEQGMGPRHQLPDEDWAWQIVFYPELQRARTPLCSGTRRKKNDWKIRGLFVFSQPSDQLITVETRKLSSGHKHVRKRDTQLVPSIHPVRGDRYVETLTLETDFK